MQRWFLSLGALFGLLGVAAGAFGVHALADRLDAASLATFETAARYQMYHALALLAVAWAADRWPDSRWRAAGWFFAAGVLLFSGSLYLLGITGIGLFGAVAPLGGVCLLTGWALSLWAALRIRGEVRQIR